jgi:hypothetical protein
MIIPHCGPGCASRRRPSPDVQTLRQPACRGGEVSLSARGLEYCIRTLRIVGRLISSRFLLIPLQSFRQARRVSTQPPSQSTILLVHLVPLLIFPPHLDLVQYGDSTIAHQHRVVGCRRCPRRLYPNIKEGLSGLLSAKRDICMRN